MGVDFVIVDGADEFQTPVIAERSPLGVDDHLAGVVVVAVPRFHIVQVLHVASVWSRSCNKVVFFN